VRTPSTSCAAGRSRPASQSACSSGSAVVSISTASAIGVAVAFSRTLWLLAFVAVGAFLVVAYNLELFDGRFHGGLWFPTAWGAFPVLTAYFASARTLDGAAFAAAAYAFALSWAQRKLSTPVRLVRRRVVAVEGTAQLDDGTTLELDGDALRRPWRRR
jgi:hypothetical protein